MVMRKLGWSARRFMTVRWRVRSLSVMVVTRGLMRGRPERRPVARVRARAKGRVGRMRRFAKMEMRENWPK